MESIRLHIKIVAKPKIAVEMLLANMRQIYGGASIEVNVVSIEMLNLPNLMDVEVGSCVAGFATIDQEALFSNRKGVEPNDIVVYIVRSTIPPYHGCASHPPNKPGAVIVYNSTPWTLAHEVGHVLGLNHVNDNNRLMTGLGTANITNPPPDLVDSEKKTMLASGLTSSVA